VAADLITNLYGNPHSASDPAKLSGHMVDETRIKTLEFFGADPEHFDLVFVANATAAIKLVMDSFKDLGNASRTREGDGGFRYFYHVDAHNSVVGVRETADNDYHCFRNDAEVDNWLSGRSTHHNSTKLGLFAYPGQSNMNGRRLPLNWTGRLRKSNLSQHQDTYSLLDAAALATTSPLNDVFRDPETAPDFTSLSFYKIFGYPDLGGLIVRKSSGSILQWGRKYFGGGTVEVVTVLENRPWFKSRDKLHESLEDGTLPFHNIVALNAAIDTHRRLYGPDCMKTISRHATFLGKRLYDQMSSLVHPNGVPVCKIYEGKESTYGDSTTQGATIAFNVRTADGKYVPYTSVIETLANERKIFVRAGQMCNPGGIASHLGFEGWHIKRLWSDGHRCGSAQNTGTEIVNGKPTGVVRVSLGAMTTIANLETLIRFLKEEFMSSTSIATSIGVAIPVRPAPQPQQPRQAQVQMPYKAREEKLYSDRHFGGQMSQEYLASPGNIFPPTPSASVDSRPPTRSGTPSYRTGRPSFSLHGQGDDEGHYQMIPRRMDPRGPPSVATDFDSMIGLDMESMDGGSVTGDGKSATGLKKLWKHKTRKPSVVGGVA
jgi:molybdenum cofactor sulfurtransferase